MTALKQTNFAGGELAPGVYGRSELAKWQAGVAQMRNFVVNRLGNAENRAGTQSVDVFNAGLRVENFTISAVQSYELVFSNEFYYDSLAIWVNIASNGARLTTAFSGLAAWAIGTTYSRGQIVSYNAVAYVATTDNNVGNTPDALVSPAWYPITTDANGNTYIQFPIPETALSVTVGVSLNVGIIKTFDTAQINAVRYFANHAFKPFSLEYHSDVWWRINTNPIVNPIGKPTGLAASAGAAGAVLYRYAICSIAQDLTTQGPLAFGPALAVSTVSTTNGNPYLITTSAAHNLQTNDLVQFSFTLTPSAGVGAIAANTDYTVTVISGTTFTITAGVGTGISSTATPGNYVAYFVAVTSATPASSTPNVISWNAAAQAVRYNVYEFSRGVWGFIGSTSGVTFGDINITPDVGVLPATNLVMFQTPNDYPAVVGIFQQRLWLGNTLSQPQSYWASRIGYYGVFNTSTPVVDADAFTFVLAGKQVQFITAFVDIGKLIVHTTNGEFVFNGNGGGAVTPTAQGVAQVGYAGSLPGVTPVPIGITDLFVQARGSMVRDLAFSVQVFNYQGKDTSRFSSHLFKNRTIVAMAWQQIPDSILWAVMSDGALLGQTYDRESELWAWHEHDTNGGRFLWCTSVPESGRDVVYFLVSRTYTKNGVASTRTFLERMSPRDFTDITYDANFTDGALFYSGVNTNTSKTVKATTTAGWTVDDTVTLFSTGLFTTDDATYGNVIVLRNGVQGAYTDHVSFTITNFVDGSHVLAKPQKTVPAWAQATSITNYGKAVSHFSGMTYGTASISVLGDGNVEAGITTAADGSFVTSRPYLNVWAGLPITAELTTLDWENQQGETIAGKKKLINELIIIFNASRGGKYGLSNGTKLRYVQRTTEPYDTANYLITGPVRFNIMGQWNPTVQVQIQQTDPLPMCISALIPSGEVGG